MGKSHTKDKKHQNSCLQQHDESSEQDHVESDSKIEPRMLLEAPDRQYVSHADNSNEPGLIGI